MGFCGSDSNAMSVRDGIIKNECFVDVLNMIPHTALALICIFVLTVWNHSVIGKFKVKTWVHYRWHNARWIFTCFLIVNLVAEIAEGFMAHSYSGENSTKYHTFVPSCVAFLGAVLSIIYYHNIEQWNSPRFLLILLVYWPVAAFLKCLKAISIYQNGLTMVHFKSWLALIDVIFYTLLCVVELNVLRIEVIINNIVAADF